MDADHGLFSPYSFSATSGNLSVRAVGSVAVRKERTGVSPTFGRVALSLAVNNATSRAISRLPYTIASRARRGTLLPQGRGVGAKASVPLSQGITAGADVTVHRDGRGGAARSCLRGAAWAQRQAFRSRRGLLRALT